jgi:hypothetical protein
MIMIDMMDMMMMMMIMMCMMKVENNGKIMDYYYNDTIVTINKRLGVLFLPPHSLTSPL